MWWIIDIPNEENLADDDEGDEEVSQKSSNH